MSEAENTFIQRLCEADREGRQRKLLRAAMHALRSYQFGNGSPVLAASIADNIEAILREANDI